jgi:beta-lactamase class A
MLSRRHALALGAAALATPALAAPDRDPRIAAIEARIGGRLGVSALDTGSGKRLRHRATERFPMCSTFKFMAVSAILHRVDTKCEDLARLVLVDKADVVGWAPITSKHIGEKLPLSALCEAAITMSDNGGANLILNALGGPQGVTGYARSIGDHVTRLDRRELALNEGAPGDPRDTTAPDATVANLRKLILGQALTPPSREKLIGWLVADKMGDARIRAGVPAGWRVGDKTGTGGHNSTNDVAVTWPPGRAPILVVAYSTQSAKPTAELEAALAEVGRVVSSGI